MGDQIKCIVGWPLCRNKPDVTSPIKGYPMCRKHARERALRTLDENAELVWALQVLGWITDPEQRDG